MVQNNEYVIDDSGIRFAIREMIANGIYHQDELFGELYPHYIGHYSKLREIIAEEKNYA